VKYRFTATRTFWRSFGKLSPPQQEHARKAFAIFKENPFDARLRSHKIHKLSARYGRIIYAAEIAANPFSTSTEILSSLSTSAHTKFIAGER
jgi:hypothetical protein